MTRDVLDDIAESAERAERARRAARRAFVREQHPDVGGDPALFAIGLAAFDAPLRPFVQVRRSRRPDRVLRRSLHRFRRRLAGFPPRTLQ